MDENRPLVSIIVRTKDRPRLLKRALQSIAVQTYRPVEAVLVNDGGSDLDIEEIRGILGEVSLNYVRLVKNVGRARAGNVGMENAKGHYVGFLDDDDEFYPDHLSVLMLSLKDRDCRIAYTDSEIISRSYNFETMEFTETDRRIFSSKDFSLKDLLIDNYIPLTTILFHKDVLSAEKGFDERFEAYEDWDLLIRCGQTHPFHHIAKVTAKYIQWSRELQIAQSSEHAALLDGEYDKVIQKHRDKYTPDAARHFRDSFAGLKALIKDRETELSKKEQRIAGLENAISERNACIEDLMSNIKKLEGAVSEKEKYIRSMHSGRGWRLLTKYYKVRDRLLSVLR